MKQHTIKFKLDKKCDEEPFEIEGSYFTKQPMQGRHITFIIPIFLIGVFWSYNIYKALVDLGILN